MGTTMLSFSDRVVIETLHNEKRSLQYIANYLGFSTTTIFNELHRLNSEYQAELAQTDFEQKVSQRGRKSSLTKNLKHLVEEKIQVQKWSPEQVAHAYSPHERGSNENRNRVLRRFIPKGQAIEELSDRQLVQINWYLNSRPLKCLNWRTPIEIFLLNLRH